MSYPIEFKVKSLAGPGIKNKWSASFCEGELEMAIPPCFEGNGGGFSPEDIYALALLNCFLATFKVFAEKSRLSFDKIEGEAKLRVDTTDSKLPWMAQVDINLILYSPDNLERAERILKKTMENSMIINSVKSQVKINWEIK